MYFQQLWDLSGATWVQDEIYMKSWLSQLNWKDNFKTCVFINIKWTKGSQETS